jgi:hypothetical protein
MSVPWQADFWACYKERQVSWWPAHRPEFVFPTSDAENQKEWTREIINNPDDMVKNWHKLGFIVQKDKKYIETERCE